MTYDSSRTLTASVNYKVVFSTLPGTGQLPLNWRQHLFWQGLRDRWWWGGLGLGAVFLGFKPGKQKRVTCLAWLQLPCSSWLASWWWAALASPTVSPSHQRCG